MKYELTIEEIKEIYNNPELLKEWLPNAFLETGKWYVITSCNSKAVFNFSGEFDEENNPLGYGVGYNGIWNDSEKCGWSYETIRLAITSEVKEVLIEEAKERGYESGNHICLYDKVRIETDNVYSYNAPYNLLNLGSKLASIIFVDGKWAEIIEATTI